MGEKEHTDTMQTLARVCQRLSKIRKHLNEDDTDNINQIISSKSSEACLSYMMDFEKKGDPHLDPNHFARLISFYTRVFSNMPLGLHCQNESYARMLIRFAELKAIQDVNEAEANFNVARSHSQNFAFVHIAHAEFAHSQGNAKRSAEILHNAIELGAKPKALLQAALQRLEAGKKHIFPVDKENDPSYSNSTAHNVVKKDSDIQKSSRISDGMGELHLSSIFSSRQTSSSNTTAMLGRASSKKATVDDFVNFPTPSVSPESDPWGNQGSVESTTTSLHTLETKNTLKLDDVTSSFEQLILSNSPETCWAYLINLEKRGNPHTDITLHNKLKDCYFKVFSRLPIRNFSKNETYAKIMIRYAELKGIDDPDEAEDHFIVARANCKSFAFVHIAHAQFLASQGNVMKATSVLLKAQSLNAQPAELLEEALQNLKAGEKQLVFTKKEHFATEPQLAARVAVNETVEYPKPASKESVSTGEWKMPTMKDISPEMKRDTPPYSEPAPSVLKSVPTPSLLQSKLDPQTPDNYRKPYANSFITPIVKRDPAVLYSSTISAHRRGPVQKPHTPLNQLAGSHALQAPINSLSNESITIKGKQFFILKMIGQGGSSKVYQVLDHKKQLFAVKYVNLEDADAQTVESYKNEIEHLNHLQQYSDQIIKLYDFEITNSYIYMLMECGNLDLNTWLRKRTTVNPLERKFYWKNMLEAVQTIHKHGIVHSDLKPANFVIVNASLKLIDFGIANRIQPDVTSIMKDSQVGTLNYMPPEAIKYTSSQHGKACSKISPKGDVWSLGCILYCMTYKKTPFQSITNQITKLHAIIDPSHQIEFPDISEKELLDVLKRCLVRNPRDRISIAELLEHPYLQLNPQESQEPERRCNGDLQKILMDLAALQSPNTIVRAANNLAKMCSSGRKLDVAECAKPI
ncbi:dual specificity protein kinase Ttk [Corythoichthys intestinalis]|uniref:dual specificity protein kinase Ttk n=1 Tax=Corythoichthys intestinalis TaxID=161448 RepID=UPI0025A572D1|nr:dual specificity protein kinase Ttk [Corythoichthys intestinalis]